jgi:hypothetical protein
MQWLKKVQAGANKEVQGSVDSAFTLREEPFP